MVPDFACLVVRRAGRARFPNIQRFALLKSHWHELDCTGPVRKRNVGARPRRVVASVLDGAIPRHPLIRRHARTVICDWNRPVQEEQSQLIQPLRRFVLHKYQHLLPHPHKLPDTRTRYVRPYLGTASTSRTYHTCGTGRTQACSNATSCAAGY